MQSTTRRLAGLSALLLAGSAFALAQPRQPYSSGIPWNVPESVAVPTMDDPAPVPDDAIVLFDGSDLDAWQAEDGGEAQWIVEDNTMRPRNGVIQTRQTFGDVQVHVEFMTPAKVSGDGQGRGNSGVFLAGLYEVQVLDSYENETYPDGQAAAIYKQTPPLVNASRGPGEWQTYDILFEAPRFAEDGSVERPAYVTVLHNGVAVQVHREILGRTLFMEPPSYEPHGDGPIVLQDHGNPVRFRNVWVRPLTLDDTDRQATTRPAE